MGACPKAAGLTKARSSHRTNVRFWPRRRRADRHKSTRPSHMPRRLRTTALEKPCHTSKRRLWAEFSRTDRGTKLLDADVKELMRCYTSVPSARASASSTSTPR